MKLKSRGDIGGFIELIQPFLSKREMEIFLNDHLFKSAPTKAGVP